MRWVDLSRHNLAVWAQESIVDASGRKNKGLLILPVFEDQDLPGIDTAVLDALQTAGALIETTPDGRFLSAEFQFATTDRPPPVEWWLETFQSAQLRDSQGMPARAPRIGARGRAPWQWLWRYTDASGTHGYALTEEEAARAGGEVALLGSDPHDALLDAMPALLPIPPATERPLEAEDLPGGDKRTRAGRNRPIRDDYGEKIGGARKDQYKSWMSPAQKEALSHILGALNLSDPGASAQYSGTLIKKAREVARSYRLEKIWPLPTPQEMADAWSAWEGKAPDAERPMSFSKYLLCRSLRNQLPKSTVQIESGRRRFAGPSAIGWVLLGVGYGAIVEGVKDFAEQVDLRSLSRNLSETAKDLPNTDLPSFGWYRYTNQVDEILGRYGYDIGEEGFHSAVKKAAQADPLSAINTVNNTRLTARLKALSDLARDLGREVPGGAGLRLDHPQDPDIASAREYLLDAIEAIETSGERESVLFAALSGSDAPKETKPKSRASGSLSPIAPLETPVFGRLRNLRRTGKVYRTGDVDERLFCETFGLRAVEYGNWVNQKERQEMLNLAYDSLADMAHALGVDRRFMGFDGELALAFGARGRGGNAAAHYEPSRRVMNLTRTMGAGTLAHEWSHALDHFLSRKTGEGGHCLSDRLEGYYCTQQTISRAPDPSSEPSGFLAGMDVIFHAAMKYRQSESQERGLWPADAVRGMTRFVEREWFSVKSLERTIHALEHLRSESLDEAVKAEFNEIAREWRKRMAPMVERIRDSVSENHGVLFLFEHRSGLRYTYTATHIESVVRETVASSGTPLNEREIEFLRHWVREGAGYSAFRAIFKEEHKYSKMLQKNWSHFKLSGVLLDKGKVGKYWASAGECWARIFSTLIHCRMESEGNGNEFATAISAPGRWSDHRFVADPNLSGEELNRTLRASEPFIGSLAKISREMFQESEDDLEARGAARPQVAG
jgi:hypothetical protein